MTRINTDIHPSDLTNEWVLAEWRELPRIVNELEKHPNRFKLEDIPKEFTLNKGHVKFFRNKLLFLARRHRLLRKEMDKRGIKRDRKVKVNLHYLAPHIKMFGCNDWESTPEANNELIERLQERFDLRKSAYHMGIVGKADRINCEHSFNTYLEKHLSKYL
ncbi:DenV endonuclease V [Vibrio phage RYC]|nr:DenV endonuclease V [Vibrio phage RYC]